MYEQLTIFVDLKVCTDCLDSLPATVEFFYKSKQTKSGLRGKCRDCFNRDSRRHYHDTPEYQQERRQRYYDENRDRILELGRRYREEHSQERAETHRRYYEKNRDAIAEYNRQYCENNPGKRSETTRRYREANREKIAEYDRAYEKENAEQIAARRSAYRAANSELVARQRAEYRRNNKDKVNQNTMRYRARKRGATVGKVCYEAILMEFGMVCHICGDEIADRSDLHFDHVIPLSRGGAHVQENIKPSHAFCNVSKGARLL